jgi:hypothetical protein
LFLTVLQSLYVYPKSPNKRSEEGTVIVVDGGDTELEETERLIGGYGIAMRRRWLALISWAIALKHLLSKGSGTWLKDVGKRVCRRVKALSCV